MEALVTWVQATWLSRQIVVNEWIWPAAETVHFIGLALVIGIIGFLDLRLIGFFPRVRIAAVRELIPYAIAGFVLNLITGVTFLIGHPEQYVYSLTWWLKVGSLVIAGLNAAVFEWAVAPRTVLLEPGEPTPLAAKCIGFISLTAWFGVLYCGRMLPFFGDSF